MGKLILDVSHFLWDYPWLLLLVPLYLLGLWWFPIFYIAFALTGVALVLGITIEVRRDAKERRARQGPN